MPSASNYVKMSVDDLTDPNKAGIFRHLADHWWPVTEDNCVLFYGPRRSPHSSPQCQKNKILADKFSPNLPYKIVESKLIPMAFCPVNISDYQT